MPRREWVATSSRGCTSTTPGARPGATSVGGDPAPRARRARTGSALRASGVMVDAATEDIELLVAADRRVHDPPGVSTSRARDFAWDVHRAAPQSPPRVRLETAALVVASRSRTGTAPWPSWPTCASSGGRRRQAGAALAARPRLPRRRLLEVVLETSHRGRYSALERRYLRASSDAHGLLDGRRQRRVRPGRTVHYRDVEYSSSATVSSWTDASATRAHVIAGSISIATSRA